jgi:hypothetical protein
MNSIDSIFFDLHLPNAPTWFYFSALLAVALFFKFSRFFSIRNLDVLALFLPMPGLLLLVEGGLRTFAGYLALLIAAAYWLVRCLLDLALVRRPALAANLNLGGLAWLSGALFVSLIAVAARQPHLAEEPETATRPTPMDPFKQAVENGIRPYTPPSTLKHWGERGLTVACHLSIVVGLVLIGWRHFQDIRSGMSAATFYLLMPYTYLLLPGAPAGLGRWDQPWPMALMVWAVFMYRWPTFAGAFLGVAVGTAFFPVMVMVPAWLSFYRGRGINRFALSLVLFTGLGLGFLSTLSWLIGASPASLTSAWSTADWQPWKQPSAATPGFWTCDFWAEPGKDSGFRSGQPASRGEEILLPEQLSTPLEKSETGEPDAAPPSATPQRRLYRMQAVYRMPLFIAYAALVIITAIWPAPKNLAHLLALSAGVLIGIQFWYADRGGAYVLWYLPFLLLLVFRPNLSSALPPLAPPDDRLVRLARGLFHSARRRLSATAPKVPVNTTTEPRT